MQRFDPQAEGGDRLEVPFGEAFRFWLKLGFISFGGPAGQIAIMHREVVERRRWLSEERFLHALNYCMLLPGPEAQQLATYIGWLLHRIPGGLVAGGLFVLPSIFVLLGLSYSYAAFGDTALVTGALFGLRPVVVAIVCEAVLRIGRRAIRSRFHLAISIGAFAAIALLRVPFPAIVVLAAVAGWAGGRLLPALDGAAGPAAPRRSEAAGETNTTADPGDPTIAPHTRPSWRRSLAILATATALWVGGILAISLAWGRDSLLVDEYTFFTRAALVTFGGAYAVLAYVSQAAVDSFGWLTQAQTVDGLALAETTPGPLIMVVQFVGFMAAWNHPVAGLSPLASGVLGALVTTWVTFLPCFLFIFLGAPYIEAVRAHRGLAAALRGVTAAVVGVILNLALVFGSAVLMPDSGGVDLVAVAFALVAFGALWRLKLDVLWVVAGGALAGLAHGLLL